MSYGEVDAATFRNAMALFPSGVTVVTTRNDGEGAAGFTASAFSSLSLDPPLILVCLDKRADCYDAFAAATQFAVSFLTAQQVEIGMRFATKGIDKFAGLRTVPGAVTNLPLIPDALVHLECDTYRQVDGGDHTIFIGKVLRAQIHQGEPLVHFNRTFGRFTAG